MRIYRDSSIALLSLVHLQGLDVVDTHLLEESNLLSGSAHCGC